MARAGRGSPVSLKQEGLIVLSPDYIALDAVFAHYRHNYHVVEQALEEYTQRRHPHLLPNKSGQESS